MILTTYRLMTSRSCICRTLSTNLSSAQYLSAAAIPHLAATRGSIINISSIGGRRPIAGAGAYCVSKAALDMLTQCLALELAPKVRARSLLCDLLRCRAVLDDSIPSRLPSAKDIFFQVCQPGIQPACTAVYAPQ